MAVGAFSRGRTADPFGLLFANGGVATTFVMTGTDVGWAARHKARSVRKPKGVWINWATPLTSPNTVTLRYETTDSNGKPSGTLYDANATKDFTPSAGWQFVQFDVLPTTARTVGGRYCVVLITAGSSTALSLRSSISVNTSPVAPLTTTTASTRSSFAVVSAAPICALVLDDDSIVTEGMCPYAVSGTTQQIYGTRAVGFEFTLLAPAVLDGIDAGAMSVTGTPSDLLAKIYSGSTPVSGAVSTNLFADILATSNTRQGRLLFDSGPVTLQPGTYQAFVQQSNTGTVSTNRYNLSTAVAVSADLIPANLAMVTTLDVTAGSVSWTKTTTETPAAFGLIFSELPSGGGGVQMPIIINL
ncbi:hypothetical protein VT84_09345 [Gemmata sp. SH-PL17]|uniref:hypothetical protein n=1 Tax=Gemmata sp. SH-PL17 TaxID=1630693 RepID=UPI00078C3E89|nr:hypothetical protein [Gemmata sp. SH-PL17]AMV24588.1 hypothetical protein VT84_09345 [Gemmata sp. SH-PL17]